MNNNYLLNQNLMMGGVYRAYVIKRSDSRVFIPGLNDKNILDDNDDISNENFERVKKTLPIPLYSSPEIEKLVDDKPTPCIITFENGNINKPIVMGFYGKGVKSVPGSNNSTSDLPPSDDKPPATDPNSTIVEIAKKYIGVPYLWGGTSPKGFDCSGFTQYVYKEFGINIPRTAALQYSSNDGTSIDKSQLKAGDLVFFNGYKGANGVGHVGIYIGNGDFIHAPKTGDVVKISPISSRKDYVGAKRFN